MGIDAAHKRFEAWRVRCPEALSSALVKRGGRRESQGPGGTERGLAGREGRRRVQRRGRLGAPATCLSLSFLWSGAAQGSTPTARLPVTVNIGLFMCLTDRAVYYSVNTSVFTESALSGGLCADVLRACVSPPLSSERL